MCFISPLFYATTQPVFLFLTLQNNRLGQYVPYLVQIKSLKYLTWHEECAEYSLMINTLYM